MKHHAIGVLVFVALIVPFLRQFYVERPAAFEPAVHRLSGEVSVRSITIGSSREMVKSLLGVPFVEIWNEIDRAGIFKYRDMGFEISFERNVVVQIDGTRDLKVGEVALAPGTTWNAVIKLLGSPTKSDAGYMTEYDGGIYWLYLFFSSQEPALNRFVVIDKSFGSIPVSR